MAWVSQRIATLATEKFDTILKGCEVKPNRFVYLFLCLWRHLQRGPLTRQLSRIAHTQETRGEPRWRRPYQLNRQPEGCVDIFLCESTGRRSNQVRKSSEPIEVNSTHSSDTTFTATNTRDQDALFPRRRNLNGTGRAPSAGRVTFPAKSTVNRILFQDNGRAQRRPPLYWTGWRPVLEARDRETKKFPPSTRFLPTTTTMMKNSAGDWPWMRIRTPTKIRVLSQAGPYCTRITSAPHPLQFGASCHEEHATRTDKVVETATTERILSHSRQPAVRSDRIIRKHRRYRR